MNQHEPQLVLVIPKNTYSTIRLALNAIYSAFISLSSRDQRFSFINYQDVCDYHNDGLGGSTFTGSYPIETSGIPAQRISSMSLSSQQSTLINYSLVSSGVLTTSDISDNAQSRAFTLYVNR